MILLVTPVRGCQDWECTIPMCYLKLNQNVFMWVIVYTLNRTSTCKSLMQNTDTRIYIMQSHTQTMCVTDREWTFLLYYILSNCIFLNFKYTVLWPITCTYSFAMRPIVFFSTFKNLYLNDWEAYIWGK